MTRPDAVVIGGGVIGLAAAWRSARAGLDVALVDPRPGSGASWAAAGMLAPVTEVRFGEEPLLRLNIAARERYPSFVAELEDVTQQDVGYRDRGTLVAARDADDNAVLADLFGFQRELGLEVERLTSRDCRVLEPSLSPGVRGGILVEGDHQVDNRALVEALERACRIAGVTMVPARATSLELSGGAVAGVATDDEGVIASPRAVLCTGCWAGTIAGVPPGALPPVRPVKGQLLHLRGRAGDDPLLTRTVRGLEVYIVPRRDGRVVVGATVEEQGFDDRITAGAVLDLLRRAYELVPGIVDLELTETTAGLRPATPDNAPAIGATPVDGLVVATGHFRNGILLCPVTADAVAALLCGGRVPHSVEPFSPRRFAAATMGR